MAVIHRYRVTKDGQGGAVSNYIILIIINILILVIYIGIIDSGIVEYTPTNFTNYIINIIYCISSFYNFEIYQNHML